MMTPMKKRLMKRIAIAAGCVLLVPVLAIGALFAMREPPDGPRIDAAPGVVGIEAGGAYSWIVRTAHGAVLVDAGLDAKGAALLAELKSQGVDPDHVLAVLITHGHPDHYAAAPLFRKAIIAAGSGDLGMIRGDTTHYATFGKFMAAIMPLPPAPQVISALRGGEHLEFDEVQFRVVATPGHSPGSVMFLYKTVLFTGDSLMRKGDGVAVAPSLFSEDAAKNRDSLRALEPLAFDTIADGHAGVTRDAREKLVKLLSKR
jgi:glyoxylase-like metal-dependent hydrolase (beta-lactamase superfamily II)